MTSLERLEDKLDKMIDSVASIDKTLAGQAIQLTEHVRRTNLLEGQVEVLKGLASKVRGVLMFLVFIVSTAEAIGHLIGRG